MMSDHRRRRSPESSRRRRKARRDSREQLAAEAAASTGMPLPEPSTYQPEPTTMRHDPSIAARPRKYSSSDLSSSSSSYLDISRRYPKSKRYGGILKSFFSAPSEHKHHYRRKKKRRIFGFGNSSSSSVNSDLAYGTGYIKKFKSRGALSPQETIHGPAYNEGRRSQPKREKTDEEIIEIGRKLAKIARDQNAQDLAAQGRRKPTSFETAASGFDKLRRQNTGDSLSRGIGASRPHGGDSSPDDSEWESASEDEFSDDVDSGLAYGASASALSLIANRPQRKPSQIVSQKPPEEIRPPDRKSSVVDPKMFGPVNSLRGYVQTPCGFDKEQPPVPTKRYSGSMAPITPVDSASIEGRPLQTVYAVPTSDPRRFDVSRGSVVSSRPDPVPIQAPKPIAPVPQRLYEEERFKDLDRRDSKSSRRQSDGKTLAEAAAVGAGVAAGIAMISDHKDKRDDRDSERRDREREREKRRQRELELEREIARREAELREREERYAREKEAHRRSKRDSNVKIIDERDQKRSSRDDRRDDRSDKRSETGKRSDRRDADVDVDYERENRRREREKRRDEPTSGHDRDKRRIKDDRKDDHRESRKEERQDARRVSQPSEQPALEYRRVEDPNLPASKAPIDPFQFQVEDDAFQTPLYSTTPMRPLTPQVVTVEREPDFSRFDDVSVDGGRKSRRDSFEDEMRDAKHIYDASSHATAPIDAAAMAAAVAAVEREQREDKRGRDPEPRSPKDPSQKEDAQAEADRYYAELRTARRIAEEQIRSRSSSPDKSVVEKYNKDEPEEPIIRIVTPPEMEHKDKNKSKYDGPNADVRIDNIIVPKDLPKFRQPPISPEGPHLPVVLFKSRDPSAERERPLLNLVLPTPAPTPTPEKQEKAPAVVEREPAAKEPGPEPEKKRTRDISIGPRGEIIESPSTPKSVTWGKNETKRYYPESPEHSRERSPDDHESKVVEVAKSPRPAKKSGGWGMIAAAIVGAGGAAAAASDEDVGPKNEVRELENETSKSAEPEQQGSPKQRTVLPKGTAPKALDEEPADLPPAPGPKPASPRSSQMPGAFADDLDFAARLAGGLEKSGFDPNIVIDNDTYRRRDSPPGSNDDYPLYKQPFAETVTDLGVYGADGTSTSKSAPEHDFDLSKDATLRDKEEKRSVDDIDIPSKTSKKDRRKQEKASRRRSGDDYKDIEVIEEPEEATKSTSEPEPEPEPSFEPIKLSKKEQRKRDKAAKAAQWADDEPAALTQEPESIEPTNAGEDEWAEMPSKKSKKSKKSKRSSSNWDEEEATPTDDRRISVPVDAFKDLQDDKAANPDDEWDTPKKSKKKPKRDSVTYDSPSRSESIAPSEASTGSSRDKSKKSSRRKSGQDYESSSRGYDLPEDEPPDKRERKRDSYKPIDRDVSSVVSDPAARYDDRYDSKSVASREDDEMGSVVSAPTGSDLRRKSSKSDKRSSKEEKRSSGSFFGLFGKSNGTEEKEKEKESSKSSKDGKKEQSFLDNAGTLGAGAGLAGAVTAYLSRSNATDTPSEKETSDIDLEPAQKQIGSSREVDIVDPEIVQRVIKPAIDPQYGDLLPLPPSEPGSPHWETPEDALPALPDSRPNTPPEQERALLRDKLHTHVRRRSAYETPVKSPSHTAIPIQFRIGQRSVPSSPGVIRSSPIPSMPSPSTPAIELGSVPQKRPSRPTSWDSSREIKPLYLLEQAGRSSSHVPDDDLDSMDLPPLPPSRESPGPEYEVKQDDVEYFRLAPSERDAPLYIDTSVGSVAQAGDHDHLGSQDSTPKAETAPPLEHLLDPHTLGSESEDAFEDAEEHIQRSMSPSPTPYEQIADDLPSLPRQTQDNEQALASPEAGRPWDAVQSQDTPVPVDPVSKDRSSYLLRSTPRSTGGDVIERSSPPSPSPKVVAEPKLTLDNLALDAALAGAAGGLVTAALLQSDDTRSQGTVTPVQVAGDIESSRDLSPLPEGSSEPQSTKEENLPSEIFTSVDVGDDKPWMESGTQDFSYTPSKKGKKGKKGRKNQLEELEPVTLSKSEDLTEPTSTISQESSSVEAPVDEWDIPKTSKKGKKKKKSQFEDWESHSDAPRTQDLLTDVDNIPGVGFPSENIQDPAKDLDFQETPSLERSSSMSKTGKKKKGKKLSTWEPEEELMQDEPNNQFVLGEVPQTGEEVEQKPIESSIDFASNVLDKSSVPDDFAPALTKKDKKKKKGKKSQAWEADSEVSQQASRAMSPEPVKDMLEVDLSTAGTGQAFRDLDLAPEQLSRPEGAVRSGESVLNDLPTSTKATPVGGPGAWVPTPATAESKPSETDYFPSAPTVHRPSVSEASQVDEKKGYFPSALSMLPIAAPLAAVGSLFGRGKRDIKDSESGDIDSEGVTGQPGVERTLDESQIAPVHSIHSSDQLPASPTANVLVEPSGASADMAPGGSLSEDKSVGDTPSSAVGTTDLLPDQQHTAPEATERSVAGHQPPQPISSGSIVHEERSVSSTPRDIHVDDILPVSGGEDESNMEPIIEEPSNVADNQPISSVDWEQETGSRKKGKKGKKNRKSVQDASQLPVTSESSSPPPTETLRHLARDEPSSTSVEEVPSLPSTDPVVDITPSESSAVEASPSSKPGKKSLKKSKKRMDSAQLVPWEDDIPQDIDNASKSAELPAEPSEPLSLERASTPAEGDSQGLPGTPPSGKKLRKEKKRLRASRTMSLSDDMANDSADDPSTRAASVDTENLNWDDLKPSRLTVFSDVGINDEDQSEADWDVPRKGKKGKQAQEPQQSADDSTALSESAQSGQFSRESAGDSAAQDTESQGLEEFQFTPKKGKSSKKKKRQSVTWADSREESPLGTSRLATQGLPQPEVKELSPISPVRKDVLFPEVEVSQDQSATSREPSSPLPQDTSSAITPIVTVEAPTPTPILPQREEVEHQVPSQSDDPTDVLVPSQAIAADDGVQNTSISPRPSLSKDLKTSDVVPEPESTLAQGNLSQEPVIPPAEASIPVDATTSESVQPSSDELSRDLPLQDQPEPSAAAAEDEFPMTTKKSKKDKKKRKSKIQDDFDAALQETSEQPITEPSAQDDLAGTLAESPKIVEESAVQPTSTSEPEPMALEPEQPSTEQELAAEDDFSWAPTTKKSKKDKKKRKSKVQDDFDTPSGTATPAEETTLLPGPSDEISGGLTEPPVIGQKETVPVFDQATEQTSAVDDDFSWAPTTKKSKKDKKKGKSKAQDDLFDSPSETATPLEETKTHPELSQDLAESSAATIVTEKPITSTRDIGETSLDESAPINLTLEPEQLPIEQEPAVEDDFSWAPTTKKSKKDKKRKSKIQDDFDASSGLATPVEEIHTLPLPGQDLVASTEMPIVSEDPSSITKDVGETGQEGFPATSSTSEPEKIAEQDPVAEDDFSWAPTKKSKKDKKKRKSKLQDEFDSASGTATPVAEESSIPNAPVEIPSEEHPSLVQEPRPLSSDILTEEPWQILTEPEPVVEEEPSEFFVSKKSKKDKKKKKSLQLDLGPSDDLPTESTESTESSTPTILPQEELSTSIADQSKDDEFSSFSTSKKSKKEKKKKRASVTWAEPETESGTQTPAVEELPESSRAIEDLVIPTEVSEKKTADILPSSTSTDSLSKLELESRADDGDDTLIVAGGVVPKQSISKPELEAKVDDGDDTIIVAGGALPEQPSSLSSQVEPTSSEHDILPPLPEGTLSRVVAEPIDTVSDEVKKSDDAPAPSSSEKAEETSPKDLASTPMPWEEASVAPSETIAALTEDPISLDTTPLPNEESQSEAASEFFTTKKSKKDKKKKRASQVQEFDPEPPSLPETPFETEFEDNRQQSLDQPESTSLVTDEPIQQTSGDAEEGYFEPLPSKKSKKDKKKAKKFSQVAFDSDASPSSTHDNLEIAASQELDQSPSESKELTEEPVVFENQDTQELMTGTEHSGPNDTTEDFFPITRKLSKKDKKKAKKLAEESWDDMESPVTEQKDMSIHDEVAIQDQPQDSAKVDSTQKLLPNRDNDTPLQPEASQPIEADTDFFPTITRKMSKKEKKKAQKLAQESWDEPEPVLAKSQDVQDAPTGNIRLPSEEKPVEKSETELEEVSQRDFVSEVTPKSEEVAPNEPEEEFQPTLSRKMSKKEKRKAQKLALFTDDTEQTVEDNQTSTSLDIQTGSLQTEETQPTVSETQELASSHETSQVIEEPVSQEPDIDDFAPITRKMSKKEKRKAQKLALSESEADTIESPSPDKTLARNEVIAEQTTVEEHLPQMGESTELPSRQDSTLDTGSKSPALDDQLQDDEFPINTKMSKKDKKKAKKQSQSSWEPEPIQPEEQEPVASQASVIPMEENTEKPTTDVSEHERELQQTVTLEPQGQESEEPVTEDWPMMTRKMSKKDKKKAKKQAQSWQDTEVESSDLPESIPSEIPVTKDLSQEVTDAPLDASQSKELDIAPEVLPQQIEPPLANEPETDDFGFSISRKKSKKDKKRKGSKQSDSEPASGTQTPAIQESTLPSVAEVVDSSPQPPLDVLETSTERDIDTVEKESIPEPTDVSPEGKKKSKKDKKRRKSSALDSDEPQSSTPPSETLEELSESKVASTAEKDALPDKQEDAIITTASPDIWANDDYFKPRGTGEKDEPPAEPPFDHVEIHPVVARELGASPDKGVTAAASERPLVGLGLIARHSSIFNENEGYAPKLLTMTSETPSTEARDTPRIQSPDVIAPSERPEASVPSNVGGVDLTPAQDRSSISHEPPFDLTGPEKRVKTNEADDTSVAEQTRSPSHADPTSSGDIGLSPREIAAEYLERGHESSLSRSIEKKVRDVQPKPQEVNLDAHDIAASFLQRQSPKSLPGHGSSSKDETSSAREIAAMYLEHEHDLKKSDTARAPSPGAEGSKADDDVAAAAGALTGGVALLAQKFGGTKKTKGKKKGKSKYVDKRTPQEDDMFDDPSLWEGADRKPMEGSRMDADTATFWDVPSEEPTKKAHDSIEDIGAQREQQHEAVTKAREILEGSDVAESPILGRGTSDGVMIVERSISPTREVKSSDFDRASTSPPPGGVAMDMDKDEKKEVRNLPTPRSPSPPPHPHESVMIEEPVLRSIEPADDEPARGSTPTVDSGRSLSRGLPPVQEEPTEEVEAERHDTTLREQPRRLLATPDVNRDSGFMADSPIPRQRSYHEDGQIRDSGVHLRDFPESSPRPSTRGFSPEPSKLSRLSADVSHHDTPKTEEKRPKIAPVGEIESRRQFREGTPVLREPPEQPHTPEPRKASTDKQSRPKQKYPELRSASPGGAALAAGPAIAAGQRSVSDNISANQRASPQPLNFPRRSASNTSISRMRTPEPLNLRPDSPGIVRHSATPPLRSKRVSGDLRSLSQRSQTDLVLSAPTSKPPTPAGEAPDLIRAAQTTTPVANEGRVRAKDMTDVYDGFGEGRIGSPRSPTRPHSMRRRQSMQVLELESKVEQLIAENRLLSEARAKAEQHLSNRATSVLAERDAEIDTLKQSIEFLRKEVDRLTEVNEGLSSANATIAIQHNDRYRQLETQHADAARELDQARGAHGNFSQLLQEKDAEIENLQAELESAKDRIREMQRQILEQNPVDAEFLDIRDVDHFDHRCQQLCSHVQQWVLRFSKFSDMRACRLTNEINDEKIIDRLDNAVLDGSDVDHYLNDRVKRRDIFMSMTMTMIWEFVFTRYLFGMDREQRQKLKSLEKLLLEVGPPQAVRQWRAVTLTLLSRRDAFKDQREQDTEAVVQAIFQTLSMILPPPSNLEEQIQTQLRRVMREAVDLAIEMRTQRAEYMMLPPLQPDYDANGDLAETVHFNASLMNERSGDNVSNEELEAQGSIVRVVLFPLVVKKGDDNGVGDDEIVVCPAQVLIAKPSSSRRSIRMVTPSSDAGGVSLLRGGSPSTAPNRSNVSMAQPEAEYLEGGI